MPGPALRPGQASSGDSAAAPTALAAAPTSLWALKPWWCQPWSILLSGVAVVAASWLLFGRWWISVPLAIAVALWWALFLVLVPAAWRAEQAAMPPRSQVAPPS